MHSLTHSLGILASNTLVWILIKHFDIVWTLILVIVVSASEIAVLLIKPTTNLNLLYIGLIGSLILVIGYILILKSKVWPGRIGVGATGSPNLVFEPSQTLFHILIFILVIYSIWPINWQLNEPICVF